MELEEKGEVVDGEGVLEAQKEEADGETAALLGIFLHALAGASALRTIRLMGRISSQEVVVLIDTRSTPTVLWILM